MRITQVVEVIIEERDMRLMRCSNDEKYCLWLSGNLDLSVVLVTSLKVIKKMTNFWKPEIEYPKEIEVIPQAAAIEKEASKIFGLSKLVRREKGSQILDQIIYLYKNEQNVSYLLNKIFPKSSISFICSGEGLLFGGLKIRRRSLLRGSGEQIRPDSPRSFYHEV